MAMCDQSKMNTHTHNANLHNNRHIADNNVYNINNNSNDNDNSNIHKGNNNNTDGTYNKWVINILGLPLLRHRDDLWPGDLNLKWSWDVSQRGDYIAEVEEVCYHLPPKVAAVLRADNSKLLNKTHPLGQTSPFTDPGQSRNLGQNSPGSTLLLTKE